MKTYLVDVEDSDGYDSTWEVSAADERQARRRAIANHFEAGGYHDWRDEESACPAIVNVSVYS